MLPKNFCVVFLCILGEVIGGVSVEELELEQAVNQLDDDSVHSYVYDQKDDEDPYPTRTFRVEGNPVAETPSLQEVIKIRGAIKQMLSGNENVFTPITSYYGTDKKVNPDKRAADEEKKQPYKDSLSSREREIAVNVGTKHKEEPTEIIDTDTSTTQTSVVETDVIAKATEVIVYDLDNEIFGDTTAVATRSLALAIQAYVTPGDVDERERQSAQNASVFWVENTKTEPDIAIKEEQIEGTVGGEKEIQTEVTPAAIKREAATKFQLDYPAISHILANQSDEANSNKINAALFRKRKKTTTTTPSTTTEEPDKTGIIMAKCFVCGLKEKHIPRHAHCAEAFSGDFLPLTPFDATVLGKRPLYRKFCRYMDIDNYETNRSVPDSVYGRWSGGCAVRWLELSGVYTQRACRSAPPVLGRHYLSNRMAQLEMALEGTDNGCISSPVASLVPLSRGISLYARFHACVCTGDWCNVAPGTIPWPAALVLILVCVSPHVNR